MSPLQIRLDRRLLRITTVLFGAICLIAMLIVLAALALPGAARAARTIDAVDMAGREVSATRAAENVITGEGR